MDKPAYARHLLNDDFFKEFMSEMRETELQRITNSLPDEIDIREEAYQRIKTFDTILARLEGIAVTTQIKKSAWRIL